MAKTIDPITAAEIKNLEADNRHNEALLLHAETVGHTAHADTMRRVIWDNSRMGYTSWENIDTRAKISAELNGR